MDMEIKIPQTERHAGDDCNEAVSDWRLKAEAALAGTPAPSTTVSPSTTISPAVGPPSSTTVAPTITTAAPATTTEAPITTTAAPTTTTLTVMECFDTDNGAVDVYDSSCADYTATPDFCAYPGDDDDFSGGQMCCECGGGEQRGVPAP